MKLRKFGSQILMAFFLIAIMTSAQKLLFGNNSGALSAQILKEQGKATPQPTVDHSDELRRARQRGTGLDDQIESFIREKEKEWKLEVNGKQAYGVNVQIWVSQKERLRIFMKRFESSEESSKDFALNRSPLGSSIGIIPEDLKDFGVEVFLRLYDSAKGIVHVSFSKDNYLVSVEGKRKDAIRFAKHVESIINSQ